jgi:S-adenosylmethionine-dependent methyltransferase
MSKERIIHAFSSALPAYLDDVKTPWGKLFYALTWHQLDLHIPETSQAIVDIGCGFGLTSIRLAQAGHKVTGIDMTPDMIEAARKRSLEHELEIPIQFHVADMNSIQNVTNGKQYNILLCHNILEYLDNPKQALDQFNQLLQSEGLLSLIVHNPNARVLKKAILENNLVESLESVSQTKVFNPLIKTNLELLPFQTISSWLDETGYEISYYYGIRCITEYITGEDLVDDLEWYERALELELEVTGKSPFRDIGPFIHIIAYKR